MGNQLKSISPSPRPYKGMKTIIALAMLFSLTLAQAKFSLDMSKLETQVGTNKSHYGNPSGGCKSDEINGGVEGHDGVACLPDCTKRNCPTDLPDSQTTAKPQCAIVDFAHGKTTVSCSARESLRESAHSGPSAPTPATLPLSA